MKNPWMSLWLSAANQISAPARGQMIAEMRKTQDAMMREWQRPWLRMWGIGLRK